MKGSDWLRFLCGCLFLWVRSSLLTRSAVVGRVMSPLLVQQQLWVKKDIIVFVCSDHCNKIPEMGELISHSSGVWGQHGWMRVLFLVADYLLNPHMEEGGAELS